MVGLREALAVALGAGLGVVFVAAPGFVVRAYALGRYPGPGPGGESGPLGQDPELTGWWRRGVQAVGVAFILGAALVGALAIGAV
ncbi:MAG: hypothetical protein ABEJ08_03665 [Halobacteriaceae archaeon]